MIPLFRLPQPNFIVVPGFGHQFRHLSFIPYSETAAPGKTVQELRKTPLQGVVGVRTVQGRVGLKTHHLEIFVERDQLSAHDTPSFVFGVHHALVQIHGIGYCGKGVQTIQTEAGVEVVAHLEDANGIRLQVNACPGGSVCP